MWSRKEKSPAPGHNRDRGHGHWIQKDEDACNCIFWVEEVIAVEEHVMSNIDKRCNRKHNVKVVYKKGMKKCWAYILQCVQQDDLTVCCDKFCTNKAKLTLPSSIQVHHKAMLTVWFTFSFYTQQNRSLWRFRIAGKNCHYVWNALNGACLKCPK